MSRTSIVVRLVALAVLVLGSALPGGFAAPPSAAAGSPATDWPMYLHDASLSAASSETILTKAAAPSLRPLWTYKTGGMIAASATVVGGVAYVGSWDGYEYALNAATGALIWKTFLGITTAPSCSPPSLGVSSVASVVGGVVYVGGGDSNWYALDAASGTLLWTVPTGDNSATGGHYNWSSPLIVGNSAYIGIASLGDCPLVQGQLLRVDLTTHTVVASVAFVPTGQVGGGVWTTPSYDPATNTVYASIGNRNNLSQTIAESMVALDATTLAIKSNWQIPVSASSSDSDWGDSPILFTDGNGRAMVAATNKNGFLYAFDRSNVALGPVWSDQIAVGGICPECGDGSVSSMAFAGGLLYVGGGNTTIDGVGYQGAIRAIDPTTGAVVWAKGLASPVIPALAYDNGMVFAGVGPRLEVLDASNGNRLFSYATGAVIFGPPSISGGDVYIGSGDGNLYAFAPTIPTTPPPDANCPGGWVCQDIGGPSPAGGETVTAGSWAISAGGAGVGGASDQVRLMSQAWTGDFAAQGRVVLQTVVGTGTQSGLMARQANDAGSPFYALSVAGGNSILVQYRTAFGGATRSIKVTGATLPVYLEIVRSHDSFSAATSSDGVTYSLVAGSTVTDVMPDQVLVGLFAASGTNGTAATSTIDSVVIGAPGTPPSPPPSPSPCPAGWSCVDVGNPPAVGDQSLSSGTWTISGSGTASANNSYTDQFHLVWQAIAGDATLSAHITTQANTSGGAQAGLVFRGDSTTAGAVSYGAFLTPASGIEIVYRTASGLRSTLATTSPGAAPAYLQITRYQNTYTAFTSPDGANWSPIIGSSVTFGTGGSMVAGLAVNSNAATLATDTLDTVSLTPSAAPPPSLCPSGWTCQDIGFPTPGTGSQYVVGSNLTIVAGGSDIWGNSDSFRLLSQPLAADGKMSVRVDSQTNTSNWAKAGVMMRATNDPGSPYFAEFVTPGNGIAVQWRASQAATTSQVLIAGAVPAWLEVSRAGGTFTAYTSADGITWTAVPGASAGLVMTGSLLAGLAVTSHNTEEQGAVTFDTATLTSQAPGPATQLAVSGLTSPRRAGSKGSLTVTAIDRYGNIATAYAGTIHFTSTDGAAVLPPDATLSSGVGTFSVTLNTVGTQSVTATDTVDATITGSQSGISVIDVPGQPTSVTAYAGVGSASVSWVAAPPNGSPISSYQVMSSPDGKSCNTTGALSCTVAGLTNGQAYTFTVTATNAVGTGPASDPSAPVTPLSGATYHAITPTRVLDTRNGTGGLSGPFANHVARTFQVTGGTSGVPSNAIAVTGNLTVTGQTSSGYLFIGPVATDNPTVSTLNFPFGDDRANGVTVALGSGGTLSITFVGPSNGTSAQAIFDVTGYFTPDTTGATYHALSPTRLLDTRDGTGGLSGPFANHVARTFQVTGGTSGVPANATAVTGNLTVTGQTSGGYLFIGPVATNDPTSSTLNFPLGDDRANGVTVALGAGGTLSITFVGPSNGTSAQAIFDVTGYFTADMTGARYVPLNPTRILDTRDGTGGLSGPFTNHVARTFGVSGGTSGVPSNAAAVTGNLTVTGQTSNGYLFIGPVATDNPTVSTLNFPLGDDRANGVTVALGGGTLSITFVAPSNGPTAQAIFDVTGYFVP